MSSNLLALFDVILGRIDHTNEAVVEQELYDMARHLGISHDAINAALDCDRGLVIYEP